MTSSLFLHPALYCFLGAALILAAPKKPVRFLLPLAGVAALACVLALTSDASLSIRWLGLDLELLRVDALSTIFAHVFAVQAILGLVFALHVKDPLHQAASLAYVGGAFGCVFAGDYLTLFVFWEVMSVASTFLIWLNRAPASTRAGFRYFLFHTLGGLLLLGGLLVRYGELGTLAFLPVDPAGAAWFDWLIMAGFCVNAAVVPLHAWLPDAYPEATVTGAVFLSAFTTKTAVYVLARGFAGFEILAVAGVAMCLYGVFYATIENNARRILAYHIVSQVGYMVAGIGVGTAMTVNGACVHAYAHILYKGLLFMGAGCLLHAAGTARLTELGGLVRRLPWVFILYMAAALSISGMPLFNGFVSKTMTIAGTAMAHHTWLAAGMEVAAVGTFLSVGLKLPYFAFYARPEYTAPLKKIPWNMYAAMIGGASLCLVTGLFPSLLYDMLPFREGVEAYSPFVGHVSQVLEHPFEPFEVWAVLQAFMLLGFAGLGFYLLRRVIVPHAQRNVDFEWFYIKGGRLFLALVSRPLALVDDLWTRVYRTVGLRALTGSARGATIFDARGIDTVVDGSAYTVAGIGRLAAKLQSGDIRLYAAGAAVTAGAVFLLAWTLS